LNSNLILMTFKLDYSKISNIAAARTVILKSTHLLLGSRLVEIVKRLVRVTAWFTLVVVVEGLRVDEHTNHDVANTALY